MDKEKMARDNQGLVYNIAKKYFFSIEKEDCLQIANVGLVKAINVYDESKGYKFSTLAVPWIEGEIKKYLRDVRNPFRCNRKLNTDYTRVRAAINRIGLPYKETPLEDIARRTNLTVEEVEECMRANECIFSYDEIMNDSGETYLDLMSNDMNAEDLSLEFMDLLDRLKPNEKDCIIKFFINGMAQPEIANEYGVTQPCISRYISNGLKKIREMV